MDIPLVEQVNKSTSQQVNKSLYHAFKLKSTVFSILLSLGFLGNSYCSTTPPFSLDWGSGEASVNGYKYIGCKQFVQEIAINLVQAGDMDNRISLNGISNLINSIYIFNTKLDNNTRKLFFNASADTIDELTVYSYPTAAGGTVSLTKETDITAKSILQVLKDTYNIVPHDVGTSTDPDIKLFFNGNSEIDEAYAQNLIINSIEYTFDGKTLKKISTPIMSVFRNILKMMTDAGSTFNISSINANDYTAITTKEKALDTENNIKKECLFSELEIKDSVYDYLVEIKKAIDKLRGIKDDIYKNVMLENTTATPAIENAKIFKESIKDISDFIDEIMVAYKPVSLLVSGAGGDKTITNIEEVITCIQSGSFDSIPLEEKKRAIDNGIIPDYFVMRPRTK